MRREASAGFKSEIVGRLESLAIAKPVAWIEFIVPFAASLILSAQGPKNWLLNALPGGLIVVMIRLVCASAGQILSPRRNADTKIGYKPASCLPPILCRCHVCGGFA